MKIRTLITVFALALVTLSVSAQDNQRQSRRQKMDTAEMFNRQAERLVKQLKLTEDKKDMFTVLYIDYLNARHNATHPKGEADTDDRIDMKNLTDEQATQLIQKQFDQTEAQLKVDKEYYPKFLEILTPAQTAQVYLRGGNNRGGNSGQQGERPQRMGGGNRGGGFGGEGGFGGGPGGDF